VQMKSNRNQICWLLHKVRRNLGENKGYKTFQEFLDNTQYTVQNIKCYEWIFGRNFNCPGGLETSKVSSIRTGCNNNKLLVIRGKNAIFCCGFGRK
jgi:hypothetical protein